MKSDTTVTNRRDCETPGLCFYKISGGSEAAKEVTCGQTPGGSWINFDGNKLDNHCQFNLPGYCHQDFNLTPGQSDALCKVDRGGQEL